jgi:glycosyltransferase involved in cell wall biosynthesis
LNKVYGGAELVAYKLAVRLSIRGNTVFLVTFHQRGLQLRQQVSQNCCIYRTPNIGIPLIGDTLHNFFVFLLTLKLKPDVIFDQGLDGYGLLARLLTKKPYLVYGVGTDVNGKYNARGIRGFFSKRYARLILLHASLALALSQNMKVRMEQILNRDIKVLTNGVDLAEVEKNLAKELPERFGKKQIIFVGNIRPVKGIEYLINAMRLIVEKEPTTRLVIVGSYNSNFIKRIPSDISEKIYLIGFVDNNKVSGFMKSSDILVLPSLSEGVPNVLLEAMAVGLPIVATNVGGIPEIISDGINGFLVEPRSSQQLAEKILLLLNNRFLCSNISQNNLLKAKSYDVNIITLKLEEYLKSIN